ncbi:MAG TPA: SDR family oxidoreductase, partial [Longimicrobiaceae bacterium]|nr:SDR family oxidoreductase [Longimicrobiaceae bacterium]
MSATTIGEAYQGRRVLFIGGTGFLGSVALSLLLQNLSALDRVYLLLRRTPGSTAERRFYERVFPGVAFEPLRERFGEELDGLLAEKLRVLEGDLSHSMLGLNEAALAELEGRLDVILNCSGLVDFHAPLEQAYRVNVLGTQHLIEVAERTGAALVHTSTSFVAGSRSGRIPETLEPGEFPRRDESPFLRFDALREIEDIHTELEVLKTQAKTQQSHARFTEQAIAKHLKVNGSYPSESQLGNAVRRAERDHLRAEQVEAGRRRAAFWGWPNVYTYTKAIGEQLIAASKVRWSIVRPTIIESAMAYPVPGWNQNVTTSAPLIMLAIEGFDMLPAAEQQVADLVPVDQVAWGILAVGAAATVGEQRPVYQIGTGDTNPLTIERVADLVGLYVHEQALGEEGSGIRRLWKANHEPRVIGAEAFRRRTDLVAGIAKKLVEQSERWQDRTTQRRLRKVLGKVQERAEGFGTDLERAVTLWNIFMPFSHDHSYRFETHNIRDLAGSFAANDLPVEFGPEAIDWRHYFLDVHIPGLRKWVLTEKPASAATRSVSATPPLLDRLEAVASSDAYRQALTYCAGPVPFGLTYAELWDAGGQVAAALAERELEADAAVAVARDPAEAWVIALLGSLRAGRRTILVGPGSTDAAGAVLLLRMDGGRRCAVIEPSGSTVSIPLAPRSGGAPNRTGTSSGAAPAEVVFVGESGARVALDPSSLAKRLAEVGQLLSLSDRDHFILPLPAADGSAAEVEALNLILLAVLYHQGQVELLEPGEWAEELQAIPGSTVVLGTDAWRLLQEVEAPRALSRVERVIDLAPLDSDGRCDLFLSRDIPLIQLLWDSSGSTFVGHRRLREPEDGKKPFASLASSRIKPGELPGQLLLASAGQEHWRESELSGKLLPSGLVRVEGNVLTGPWRSLENTLFQETPIGEVAILPESSGVRVLLSPDIGELDTLQQLRRRIRLEVRRHNADAELAVRVMSVGVTLSPLHPLPRQDAPELFWIDTRDRAHPEREPDLAELLRDSISFFLGRFPEAELGFFLDHLLTEPLTEERLLIWERVLLRAVRNGGIPAQAFLQAFDLEASRTRRPQQRVARGAGRAVQRVQDWLEDENPTQPLLPEPLSEAVRHG